jgi:hypothetical protein
MAAISPTLSGITLTANRLGCQSKDADGHHR